MCGRRAVSAVVLLLFLCAAHALEVALQAPLTVLVRAPGTVTPGAHLVADLIIPADAPADLGLGVYVSDRHGRWFQHALAVKPVPGPMRLRLPLADSGFLSEPVGAAWTPDAAAVMAKAGLYLWSASASRSVLRIDGLRLEATAPSPGADSRQLLDLTPPRGNAVTGTRWELSLRPQPFPANPYDTEEFRVDALVTCPDGSEQRIPGFFAEPMARHDRGDREELTPNAAGRFTVRFRPRQPGTHRMRLEARWQGGTVRSVALPDCVVSGQPWDDYVRVDAGDPRFLSRSGRFVWPLGPNLRSVNDLRSQENLQTRLTPDRGSFAYDAYLERFAAHGVTSVEVWLSSWNLALEWRADWPPFHGQGRYSQENAWKLDHLLDRCAALGLGVVLVIDNHGKASIRSDAQWADNPYNRERGGRLKEVEAVFTDPWAKAGQEELRRYLVARYADHPALMMWKLWSEVNLTNGTQEALRAWHQQAAAHLRRIDTYRHPVTTHWSQDYHIVDRVIAALPEIDVIAIDAYHGPGRALASLLVEGLYHSARGLARFNKPVIITEFGAQWNAGAAEQVAAEHALGPWVGLVTGYAASPKLWWFEWLDQGARFAPYQALSRFIAGEDLRGKEWNSAAFTPTSQHGTLWSRVWYRPGRMLGYVLDSSWGLKGGEATRQTGVRLPVASSSAAGAMRVEWWDADTGLIITTTDFTHPGGELVLTPPPFQRHLAFKFMRLP